jgi:predicted DNA-binding protein (MmcQ/YjbR family)
MAKKKAATDEILAAIRDYGLALPGAHLKSPWPGHKDLAVDDKTFAYLNVDGEPLYVGCKLPRSNAMALMLPGAEPMAYGLGKSGWVGVRFDGVAAADIDVDMLKQWIDESYRAQAPKRRIKELGAGLDATKPVKQVKARSSAGASERRSSSARSRRSRARRSVRSAPAARRAAWPTETGS